MKKIYQYIAPVYKDNYLELAKLIVMFFLGAYLCYLTDQLPAYLLALVIYSMNMHNTVRYLEGKIEQKHNVNNDKTLNPPI